MSFQNIFLLTQVLSIMKLKQLFFRLISKRKMLNINKIVSYERLDRCQLGILFHGIKVIRNLKYYRQFFKTLRNISNSPKLPLSMLIIEFAFIKKLSELAVFYKFDVPDYLRLSLLDYFWLTGISKEFNIIFILIYTLILLLHYNIYRIAPKNDFINVTYQVLIRENARYFLVNKRPKNNQNLIKYIQKLFIDQTNTFFGMSNFLTCLSALYVEYLIAEKLLANFYYFFLTPVGLFTNAFTHLNVLLYFICMFTHSNVFQLSIILPSFITKINFIRLKQADELLQGVLRSFAACVANPRSKQINSVSGTSLLIKKFHSYHTWCLQSIFQQDKVFRFQLLTSLLFQTPINAYIVISILLGRIETKTAAIFVFLALSQMFQIFGVQLLAVQYPIRIAFPGRYLRQIYVQCFLRKILSLQSTFKLIRQMESLNCQSRFGISYAKGATQVSMSSFLKVLFKLPD